MNPAETIDPTSDEHHMRRCIELAGRALDAGDVPVGAIVVRGDQVVGEGWERMHADLDPAAHAEVVALRAACEALGTLDLSGCTLYTTVEPCILCAYATRQSRITRVVYGVRAGSLGGATGPFPLLTDAASFPRRAPPAITAGVLAAECARLLEERR